MALLGWPHREGNSRKKKKKWNSDFEACGGWQLLKDLEFCVLKTVGDFREFSWDPELREFKPRMGMFFKGRWSLLQVGPGHACLQSQD